MAVTRRACSIATEVNRQLLGQDLHLLNDDAFHGAPKQRRSALVEMGVGPFHELAALPQQPLPARAPNATTIRIHRRPGRGLALPVAPPAVRLRDVTAHVKPEF